MKKDNVLKKEFSKRDVERMRNLVKGNAGDRTTQSIGYSKKQEFYKEGDVWEENGRTWTIENGIKQNITKLDKAKKAHTMPLFCPKCSKLMKRVDKPYYNIHQFCLDCFAKFEDKLKAEGKYQEYYKEINNKIIDNRIEEYKQYVEERINESNSSFVSEDGDVENWVGKINVDKVNEYTSHVIEHLESLKTK